MPVYHPHHDDAGKPVILAKPSTPTPLACWDDPTAIARVMPDGPLPVSLNGLALAPWTDDGARGREWPWEAAGATLGIEAPHAHGKGGNDQEAPSMLSTNLAPALP